jgi:hypothetical protein
VMAKEERQNITSLLKSWNKSQAVDFRFFC